MPVAFDRCQVGGIGQDNSQSEPVPPAEHDLQTRLFAMLVSGTSTMVGSWDGNDAFAGVRSLITVARHPDVLPALRAVLGLGQATIATGRFERMRTADRVVILETVAHWIEDWPHRLLVAAGTAAPTQRTFRKVAQPGDLACQMMRRAMREIG